MAPMVAAEGPPREAVLGPNPRVRATWKASLEAASHARKRALPLTEVLRESIFTIYQYQSRRRGDVVKMIVEGRREAGGGQAGKGCVELYLLTQ
jgi:hypothetical protein